MEYTIESLEERPVLGIRARLRLAEIGNTIGALMPRLMAVAGPHCVGPPLARWHAWEEDQGEMELAAPVRPGTAGQGDVQGSVLPAGRAVVVTYRGPYDGLAAAWKDVRAWVEAQGLESRAAPWEEYLDDPGATAPEALRTRIVWPVV